MCVLGLRDYFIGVACLWARRNWPGLANQKRVVIEEVNEGRAGQGFQTAYAQCLEFRSQQAPFLLGVPVGGDAFTQQFTSDVRSKLDDMLKKSFRLQSGLGKFLILRACVGACRVNHLLRALDLEDSRQLAIKSW